MQNNNKTKKSKKSKIINILLVVCIIVAAGVFIVDRFAANLYEVGESVPQEVQTPDELKDDVINILVCGIDYNEDRTSQNTDVIMYVSLDIKNNKISAMQIPRDTFVGSDAGGNGKINSVYSDGDEENKIFNLINVLYEKFKLPVDHYATLDMQAFIAMVDGIDGGLEMYVPYPITLVDDETGTQETIIKTPGWYYVDGYTAEKIVRNRNYPTGDTARLEVQSYFYSAIIKYFTENFTITDFYKTMSRFTQHLTTDLHWTKIYSIAGFAFEVPYENMSILTPSVHGYMYKTFDSEDDALDEYFAFVEVVDESWLELINGYLRPQQEPLTAQDIHIPNFNIGTLAVDYGQTENKIQTIADIFNNSPEN